MKNDCARQQSGAGTKEQRGEDVAEKRLRLFAQEVMPALEELSPQPLQTATSMGKHCVQAICHKEEGVIKSEGRGHWTEARRRKVC